LRIKLKKRGRNQWHIIEPHFMCKFASDLDIANHERTGYLDDDDGAIYLPQPFEDTYIVSLNEICLRCRNEAWGYAKLLKVNYRRAKAQGATVPQ
jgi:hypothetical protein